MKKRVVITTYHYYVDHGLPVWRGIGYDEDNEPFVMDVYDERIRPRMYVVAEDYDIFMESIKSKGFDKLIVWSGKSKLKSVYDEDLMEVHVRLPEHVRRLRDAIPQDVKTVHSDVPWEKNVTYMLGWSSPFFLIDMDKVPEFSTFVPLDAIQNGHEYEFTFKRHIAYWDIETDNSATGIGENIFLNAEKIPILSYVLLDPVRRTITYYANSPSFENGVEQREYRTVLNSEVLSLPLFESYPRTWKLVIKRFKRERDMHVEFINDFSNGFFNELVTFNGRGGNTHFRGKKEWRNGYDMPLFYVRCEALGLTEEIQRLSPFPYRDKKRPNVYPRIERDAYGNITKYDVFIRGVAHHDLYYDDMVLFYTRNLQMKHHDLDSFLETFLGIHKVEHKGISVWDLFYKNPEKEMEYNIVDVEGLYALDVKLGYTNDIWMRASMFNAKIEEVVYTTKIHDHITLMLIRDKFLFDTKGTMREWRYRGFDKYANVKAGGFNLDAKAGIYGYREKTYGIVLDFKSLYPSIIKALNAGPRTKIELKGMVWRKSGLYLRDFKGEEFLWNDCARSVNGGFYRKDRESIERFIYTYLNDRRNEVKKKAYEYKVMHMKTGDGKFEELAKLFSSKEYAVKPLINGRFGATGYEGSRTYDIVIYNTPTVTGQYLIKEVIRYVEERGYEVVLASTDSAFVILKEDEAVSAYEEAKRLRSDINEHVRLFAREELNVYADDIEIDIEKLFDVAIILNKRYYVLNVILTEDRGNVIILEKPKRYVKGMESIRRDSAEITGVVQRTIVDMICERKSVEEIRRYLKKVDREFETYPWVYICQRAGISGSIREGKGAKYDACRLANRVLGKYYGAGSNPLYAKFVRHPSKFNGVRIKSGPISLAFDEDDEEMLKKYGFVPDYNHLKEVNLYSKIDDFVKLLGGTDGVHFIKKRKSLGDYFE